MIGSLAHIRIFVAAARGLVTFGVAGGATTSFAAPLGARRDPAKAAAVTACFAVAPAIAEAVIRGSGR